MGTTRVKVIDLSSAEKEKKAVKKHVEKPIEKVHVAAPLDTDSQAGQKIYAENQTTETTSDQEQKAEPENKPKEKIKRNKSKSKPSQKKATNSA